MDPEEPPVRAETWPPPHLSPPLPPPREYGSPGTPPARHPWLWAALAALVVGAVVSGGMVYLVRGLGDADPAVAGPDPVSDPTTATATATTADQPAPYRCWDGGPAQQLADCSAPEGEAGLRWVFPATASEKCGAPTEPGDGAALRLLCRHVLGDGTKIQVGYYHWRSVGAAVNFYEGQGLEGTKQTGPDGKVTGYQWSATAGNMLKLVALYGQEPYSATFTMPAKTALTPDDQEALSGRPAEEIRGEPVG